MAIMATGGPLAGCLGTSTDATGSNGGVSVSGVSGGNGYAFSSGGGHAFSSGGSAGVKVVMARTVAVTRIPTPAPAVLLLLLLSARMEWPDPVAPPLAQSTCPESLR